MACMTDARALLDARRETDTAPYMVYLFDRLSEQYFGASPDFRDKKRQFNDLVLRMESGTEARVMQAEDPLAAALVFARIGNYIDFGAMPDVSEQDFLAMLESKTDTPPEADVYADFLHDCAAGHSFLLLADNCGELVLDKLFLRVLHARFPHLALTVLVRGGDVLNDATRQDADYVGLDRMPDCPVTVVDSGLPLAGTVPDLLPPDVRGILLTADVLLSKGQGNYESLSGCGLNVYYSFLCKCPFFADRFGVPLRTGMFVREKMHP